MTNKKRVDVASLMMLVWLVFYIFAMFFATKWADFLLIIGCTVPMVMFKKKHRGATFGAKNCNTVKYKRKEYFLLFVICICGCAIISALTYIVFGFFGATAETSAARSDFLYLFVFSCFIPAFFEEWLIRGGILGALASEGGKGVALSALFFMLMHFNLAKWPYALFAGVCITALVYLTECIYLGMLLHFVNNIASLLLSYLPQGKGEYIALAIIALAFFATFKCFKQTSLYGDIVKLLHEISLDGMKELFTPMFKVFIFAVVFVLILIYGSAIMFSSLPSQ